VQEGRERERGGVDACLQGLEMRARIKRGAGFRASSTYLWRSKAMFRKDGTHGPPYAWPQATLRRLRSGPTKLSIHFGATRAVRSNEAPLEGAAERAEQVGIRPERPPVARWTSRRASRQTGQRSSTARRRGKRSRREFSEIAAFKVQFPRRLKDQSLFGSFRSFF